MESKTLEELRAMARAMGLRGYSKLRKDELLKLLKQKSAEPRHLAAARKPPATRTRTATPAKPKAAAAPHVPAVTMPEPATPPPAPLAPQRADISTAEERIENAKYAVAPPGMAPAPRAPANALHEDVERLPVLPEPALCLLPQKPGILFAYWALTAGTARLRPLKLRLCRVADGAVVVLEEIDVPGDIGQWYFHVRDDVEAGAFYAHLGYYDGSGQFVTAARRGVARVPSLYAAAHTDRLWWIDDERFRAMYLRAGGQLHGARLGWAGSTSSPGGAAPAGERFAWPGFISSR